MSGLLSLPAELLVLIYGNLDRIKDAVQFALCCKKIYGYFRTWTDRLKIIHSIIGNKILPKTPDAAWLEARFGVDSLWKPKDAELPRHLSDEKNRAFLTTVGFPSVECELIQWDSSHLKREAERGEEMHAWDEDEIFARRYPDDDSKPTNFCYHFGSHYDNLAMVGSEANVMNYYQGGFGDSHDQGLIGGSIPDFLVLLGTIKEVAMDVGSYLQALHQEGEDKWEEERGAIYEKLVEVMEEYDGGDLNVTMFWGSIIEIVAE